MGGSSSSRRRRRRDDYYPPPPLHYSSYPPPPPPPHHHLPPPHHGPSSAAAYYYHHPPAPHAYHPPPPALMGPPPEFVGHQQALKVKNDVNLRKDTIRLVPDPQDPDRRLVSFTFDAVTDGSLIIYYFAKEGKGCSFSPVYKNPDLQQTPTKTPFHKGLAQNYVQPSGSGIDLGFFSLDELSNPSDEVFPLVVYAEACPSPEAEGGGGQPVNSTRAQITLAAIEKPHHDDDLRVKVVKQILWIDGVRYELKEIFGIVSSTEADVPDADGAGVGKECVICLTEQRDTAVFPCRHLCMCSGCAQALSLHSDKCPICRHPIEKLIEIKVTSPEP